MQTLKNFGLLVLVLLLMNRCTISNMGTGSVVVRKMYLPERETVEYFSYSYLCAAADSAKNHNGILPDPLQKMNLLMKENILSKNISKGGIIFLKLTDEGEIKEKWCEVKKGTVLLMKQNLEREGTVMENFLGTRPGPSYSGSLRYTYYHYDQRFFFDYIELPSEGAITFSFSIEIYRPSSKGKPVRKFLVKPNREQIKISY